MIEFESNREFPDLLGTLQPFAAIDLGSNNFHVIIAMERPNNRWQIIDRHKELTRLAQGIDETNVISRQSLNRALRALERVSQRLRNLPRRNIRVVGTHTLRAANNAYEFIRQGEEVLGHRIEVISGREEARLIYLGASHSFEHRSRNRLVVDIGGGSTEIVQGTQFQPHVLQSFHMGCISLTDKCFADGKMTPKRFRRARDVALDELQPFRFLFRSRPWDVAVGTSGTLQAVQFALNGLNSTKLITYDRLTQLIEKLCKLGHVEKITDDICNQNRAPVFAGGVAIADAILQTLDIQELHVTDGALREGVLYDLLGRTQKKDIRETSVQDLIARFHIDTEHCQRVTETALELFQQVQHAWSLDELEEKNLLRWASLLHEIGMDISHSKYHRHGEYLLQHLDLAGFSQSDQRRLAILVRAHRRRFPLELFVENPALSKLASLLRLATVLRRNRSDEPTPTYCLNVNDSGLDLKLPRDWLRDHRLTLMDLQQEVAYMRSAPYQLTLSVTTNSDRGAN
ncbi:MAG: Ppx/GppA family phosphatase [Gammaproteobacteria bacterium]|nr:Ppx/GppA family phosphatase [Gammaproteobacteria bacterium]MYF37695.1 Ppx/GppA family phosphatase [Gammaproteobacteria bacterium]